ncbi:hypothetical protein NX784_28035 [Massilia pinisoli]|uniref:Uncharacterized protein n=1 Tax=Massilia pinisoli TaxID=1772194 RepID=A0ABT2A018_9BURK|nr:hypothetical protein [Massilia pinisoli]MCS0585436.1 hypothetical protein [Massilia pinisoli]
MFDAFAALETPKYVAMHVELHNVRLLDVVPGTDIYQTLTIEYQGETRTVVGGGQWSDERSRRDVGKVGYLVRAASISTAAMPAGACYFRPYLDQSLRRVPELDDLRGRRDPNGRVVETVGWWCESKPRGFLAPANLVPGENGRFIPDETIAITVRIPPEFVRECRAVQRSPEEVLHGFVGDLAGISNYVSKPRADKFGSNGSDERRYAEQWLDRAYGMDRADVDALEADDAERAERQCDYDDLAALLDDYVSAGGTPSELLNAVERLVASRAHSE